MNINFPSENLLKSVNDLMSQPLTNSKGNMFLDKNINIGIDSEGNHPMLAHRSNLSMSGGLKSKKSKDSKTTSTKKKTTVKKESKTSTSSKKPEKKPKQIDIFKKPELEKLAKKHDVSLKTREGKPKTKKQLFNSLKRKDLV